MITESDKVSHGPGLPDKLQRTDNSGMDPEKLNAGRDAVWEFLFTTVRDDDLRSAWPILDPATRRKWVRAWFEANEANLLASGHAQDEAVEYMTLDSPAHRLWPDFERVALRELQQNMPPPEHFGMGANERLVFPDIAVFHIHDTRITGSEWSAGQQTRYHPVLVRWNGERWLILDVNQEEPTLDLL